MNLLNFVTRQNPNLLSKLFSQFKPNSNLLPPLTFSKLNVSPLSSTPYPDEDFFQKALTIMSLFKTCSTMEDLKLIHGRILKTGFDQDLFAMGKLVELSLAFRDTDYAASAFDSIKIPDGFVWNTMIRGFGKNDKPEMAMDLYRRMRGEGKLADSFTFAFLFKVSWKVGSENLVKQLHGSALKLGFDSHVIVMNNLIHVYGFLGGIENADQMFDEMLERDVVTWNTIINCHVIAGNWSKALRLFTRMLRNLFFPDKTTFLSAMSACSSLSLLDLGKQIHSLVHISGFENVLPVSNSLVHVYAECGALDEALKIFDKIENKNLVTWNTMILALATHGQENKSLELFSEMVGEDLETPDHITFLGVLSACSRSGMVDKGREFFDLMVKKYNIKPNVKHYGCMVDLLGKAGRVSEAYRVALNMPMESNAIVWRTLLAACGVHGEIEIGRKVRERLLELEPDHSGDYVLLGNLYASANQWSEVVRERKLMRNKQVWKPEPGFSFVGNV